MRRCCLPVTKQQAINMDVIRLIWLKIHLVGNSQHSDAEEEKAWLSPQHAQGQ